MTYASSTARLLGVSLLVLAGCRENPEKPPAPSSAGGASLSPARTPLTLEELPTTDPKIAVGNFNAQLAGAEKTLAKSPKAPAPMAQLAGLLLMRARFFGTLDDYDRALELADKVVKAAPKDEQSYLLRAVARSSLHRFKDALDDLAAVEKMGIKDERVGDPRAGIYQALGQYDKALPLREKSKTDFANIVSLSALASLKADLGQTDEAEKLYIEAQRKYRDVNPFAVATLYFQEGLMWQKAGSLSRARELFGNAHERLPQYAQATSHLAAVEAATGSRPGAITMLRNLVEKSDDPEYAGQLSTLLRESGDNADADKYRDRAKARYEQLLKKHPEAFADHAARFFVGPGGDGKRALKLAQKNLELRKTSDAYELVVESALAAAQPKLACDTVDQALALPRPSATLRLLASRAYKACGRAERADAHDATP